MPVLGAQSVLERVRQPVCTVQHRSEFVQYIQYNSNLCYCREGGNMSVSFLFTVYRVFERGGCTDD